MNSVHISNLLCRDNIDRRFSKQAIKKYKQLVKEYYTTHNKHLILNQIIILKYRFCNYIGFHDIIPNGFFDTGRIRSDREYSKQYVFETNINFYTLYSDITKDTPEILLLDDTQDIPLQKYKKDMQLYKKTIDEKFSDTAKREYFMYKTILKYVDAVMTNKSDDRSTQQQLYELMNTIGVNIIPIGFITKGVCRHKSLLFKILCDSIGYGCMLVRGELKNKKGEIVGSHAWNIIRVSNKPFIVDVRNFPDRLLDPGGDVYAGVRWRDLYKREGKEYGNIGDSVI